MLFRYLIIKYLFHNARQSMKRCKNKKKQKYVSITKSSNEKYIFGFITASNFSCPLSQNETLNVSFVMTKKEGNETKGNPGTYSKLYKYYNISKL